MVDRLTYISESCRAFYINLITRICSVSDRSKKHAEEIGTTMLHKYIHTRLNYITTGRHISCSSGEYTLLFHPLLSRRMGGGGCGAFSFVIYLVTNNFMTTHTTFILERETETAPLIY